MSGSRKSLKKTAIFNPRAANHWSKDDSKYGQKLLEKMGWKKGQGIGANNQGIAKNISVRLKVDTKGLGYRIKEDEWVAVESGFSEILSKLSECSGGSSSRKTQVSLEATSQVAKTRVHYQKFTRGKDISKYNQQDLAGILGMASVSAANEKEEFIQKGFIDDYFQSKKRKFSNSSNGNVSESTVNNLDHLDVELEAESKKFIKKGNLLEIQRSEDEQLPKRDKKEKRRKRKGHAVIDWTTEETTADVSNSSGEKNYSQNDGGSERKRKKWKKAGKAPNANDHRKEDISRGDKENCTDNFKDSSFDERDDGCAANDKAEHVEKSCHDEHVKPSKKKRKKRDEQQAVVTSNDDQVKHLIKEFEERRETLLNKYRERYKNKCSQHEDPREIKVFGDGEFDGRLLDCKGKAATAATEAKTKTQGSKDDSFTQLSQNKKLSRAQRIVLRSRLLRKIQENAITHDFTGSNLSEILGYRHLENVF